MRAPCFAVVAVILTLGCGSSQPRPTPLVVEGNGVLVPDGTLAARVEDGTDFGASPSFPRVVHRFVVRNTGADLVTFAAAVAIEGSSDFSVATPLPWSLAGGASATLDVAFRPSRVATQRARVVIAPSVDHAVAGYSFTLEGAGRAGYALVYAHGRRVRPDSPPSTDTDTALGALRPDAVPLVRRYVLINGGAEDLPLGAAAFAFEGPQAADFALADAAPEVLRVGTPATVAVSFLPGDLGERTATLVVAAPGGDDGPPRVALRGRGATGVPQEVTVECHQPQGIAFLYPVLIDADGDGALDLLLLKGAWPAAFATPVAYRNDGAGGFTEDTAALLAGGGPAMASPRHWIVTDMNGDGRADLVIADHGYDRSPAPGAPSHLLLQSEQGQLVDEGPTRLPQENAFTHDITVGDIDADGDLDIYMGNVFGQEAIPPRFFVNDGALQFTVDTTGLPELVDYNVSGEKFDAAALVDVDLDGDLDLVLGTEGGTQTGGILPRDVLLLNDGYGHFTRAPEEALPLRGGSVHASNVGIYAADFNNDGWPDLLMLLVDGELPTGELQLLLNQGDGTFRDAGAVFPDLSAYLVPGSTDCWPAFASLVDLDLDGRLDIVAYGNTMLGFVLRQTADGRFVETRVFDTPPYPKVVAGDVTGDGVPDLVVAYLIVDF